MRWRSSTSGPSSGQHVQATHEPLEQLLWRVQSDAGGRQLDGEGQAVEVTGDLGDRCDVGFDDVEGGVDGPCPGTEEHDRVAGLDGLRIAVGPGRRQRQRGYGVLLLPDEPQG